MRALIVLHTGFEIWKILIREYSRINMFELGQIYPRDAFRPIAGEQKCVGDGL